MCGEKVDIEIAKGPGNKARDRRGDGRPVVRDSRRERSSRRSRSYDRRSRSRDRRRRSYSRSRSPPRRGYSEPRDSIKVKMTNISTRCSSRRLKERITDATDVSPRTCEAHSPDDRVAIVTFDKQSDADRVVEKMNGMDMYDRKITVELENPKSKSRSRGRSRSRSRSRSGSRGRSNSRDRDDKRDDSDKDSRKSVKSDAEENGRSD